MDRLWYPRPTEPSDSTTLIRVSQAKPENVALFQRLRGNATAVLEYCHGRAIAGGSTFVTKANIEQLRPVTPYLRRHGARLAVVARRNALGARTPRVAPNEKSNRSAHIIVQPLVLYLGST